MSSRLAFVQLYQSVDGYNKVATTLPTGVPGFVALDGTNPISGSFFSQPIRVVDFDSYRFSFVCPLTGAPVGSVSIQATIDEVVNVNQIPNANDLPLADWTTLQFSVNGGAFSGAFVVANATNIALDENRANYAWVRLLYTATSGICTPTARMRLKGNQGR